MELKYLVPNLDGVRNGQAPLPVLPPTVQAENVSGKWLFQFPSDTGNWYSCHIKYTYYFQQAPSTVEFAPHPTVSFDPQHFAATDSDDMEGLIRSANPAVAPKKMRQSAIQVYVLAEGQIRRDGLAGRAPTSMVVKSYAILDDVYVL